MLYRIQKILRKRNGLYLIFFERKKEPLEITEKVLVDFSLHKGGEVSSQQFKELYKQSKLSVLLFRALQKLQIRSYSKKDMDRSLAQKEYGAEERKWVIEKLVEMGYLNDESFAQRYVEKSQKKGWSATRIRMELKRKGVVLQDDSFFNKEEEKLSLESLLKKKYSQLLNREPDERKRMYKLQSYLFSKGFQYEDISSAWNEYKKKRN